MNARIDTRYRLVPNDSTAAWQVKDSHALSFFSKILGEPFALFAS